MKVQILNFSGHPLSDEEGDALFFAAVAYLQQGKSEEVRFRHGHVEGHLKAKSRVVLGEFRGMDFSVELGNDRRAGFLLPSFYEETRLPENAVKFMRRSRVYESGKRQTLN